MRQYANLDEVKQEHRAIDARLANWSRWAVVHGSRFIQPCFRGYRSDESFDDVHAQQRPLPIDASDALKIEKAVVQLPEKHKLSLVWFYRIRCKPVKACKALGVTRLGLAGLIHDARAMLINRNA